MADSSPLDALASRARQLANDLFGGPDSPACKEKPQTCLQRERARKVPCDHREGTVVRGFDAYDPDKLCLSCRAYWFAERAAQSLEREIALRQRFGTPAAAPVPTPAEAE